MKRKVKKTINIRHYKNKQEMNIGIVLFAFIFIYLVVTIFTYATAKRISVYEVREGSIVKDNSYTGLVLRKEQVFYADASGYVNYFQDENSKLRKGNNIYVLSNNKLNIPSGNDTEGTTLTNEEQNNLIYKIQDFNESYTNGHFSSVYSLKTEINSALHGAANQSKTSQLDAVIAGNSDVIATYPSDSDGILVLNVDGYENLTEDTLDNKNFDRSNYESTQLTDQTKIKAGDPVYKVVTDENWDVYIQLDKKTAASLAGIQYVKTRINKNNDTIWAGLSIVKKGDDYYGHLAYDTAMIQYSNSRFLSVELILDDQSGLKIPKSAVIEKLFYTIPGEYLTTSGNSSSQGVMIQDGDSVKYQTVDIYYTEADGTVYLNPEAFESGTVLIKTGKSGTQETYSLGDQRALKGVFCINKGYAVFKTIQILCENDDYYIIQEGTAYGLSNYDHIVQDGHSVTENEVVFQ